MTPNASSDPDRTRADIEATRAELGATVQALAARTNVRARGRDSALEIGGRARRRLTDSAQVLRDRAAKAVQTARPKTDGAGLDGAARALRDRLGGIGSAARRHPLLVVVVATTVGLVVTMRQYERRP
ncbi:DUF3618 domain-containing protein [Micromonospora sp. SD12]|uniref:DUF3618 domain-containing protein n=1 Tax=Micromonospora sp. SD12 TaxID=3452216 RepID=UPI003F8AB362